MEIKSKRDITFQDMYYKRKITDVSKDVEKCNFCTLLVGMENDIPIMEQFGSPSKNYKDPKIIIRSRNHLFEFMSKGYKARMFQDVSTISYPLPPCTQQPRWRYCPVPTGR